MTTNIDGNPFETQEDTLAPESEVNERWYELEEVDVEDEATQVNETDNVVKTHTESGR